MTALTTLRRLYAEHCSAEDAYRTSVRHDVRLWTAANHAFDALQAHAFAMGWRPGRLTPNPLPAWCEAQIAGEEQQQHIEGIA